MKILYYTSGITGSGRVVRGISIGNAFKRKGLQDSYTILSSSKFAFLADDFGHIEIPPENPAALDNNHYLCSGYHYPQDSVNP